MAAFDILLAIDNSVVSATAGVSTVMKSASKFRMVTTLAAIGLHTSLINFKKAGLRPMFYSVTIDTRVTLTALVVICCTELMRASQFAGMHRINLG